MIAATRHHSSRVVFGSAWPHLRTTVAIPCKGGFDTASKLSGNALGAFERVLGDGVDELLRLEGLGEDRGRPGR
jgi:hypothetical protein